MPTPCKHRPKTVKKTVMSSFHGLQDLFLVIYENGTIEDNAFSVPHEEFMPQNLDFSCEEYINRFSLKRDKRCRMFGSIYFHGIKCCPKNNEIQWSDFSISEFI